MKKLFWLIVTVGILITQYSCSSKSNLDWQKEEVSITTYPFYKTIDSFRKSQDINIFYAFKNTHPLFMDVYLNELLPWRSVGDFSQQMEEFKEFLAYEDYSHLLDTLLIAYPKTDQIDASLKKMLQHVKAIQGGFMIPTEVYYFFTGLNYYYAIILDDDKVGIGLDMFLGADYPHYQNIEYPIPSFLLNKMESKHIPLWLAQNIYLDQYPLHLQGENLLSLMIQKGKEYFFLEQVLPDIPIHEIFGFTSEQFKWAEEQERNIYNFFLENELMYSKDQSRIIRYISETYTTAGFDSKSPGNLGSFIGWKIVSKFAQSEKNLLTIFKTPGDVAFLKKSNYKP